MGQIRNFAIIAHIDHGKSTLADRLLERTGTLSSRGPVEQYLDKMELERERGITIKAQTVRMSYRSRAGESYVLNLIDTPGHVDFHYEVSRSLAACEGVLLVVDAVQGVEAQTVANAELAVESGLEVLPVINKIDLPNADPERVASEIEDIIGISTEHALRISAKTGEGTEELLEAIVERIPPPKEEAGPLRALIFDSWFDPYQGAAMLVRVMQGTLREDARIALMATGGEHELSLLGVISPEVTRVQELRCGEVGVLLANIRTPRGVAIGDTVIDVSNPATHPLPGFRPLQPMVWSGLYPADPGTYGSLRSSIEKLQLNDSSLSVEPETSEALSFGFRCGYLGLLHMEIVRERLEREYNLELIITAPTVVYRVRTKDGRDSEVHRPSDLPEPGEIEEILEPRVLTQIHLPTQYLGGIIQLCQDRRGVQRDLIVHSDRRAVLRYDHPLAEIMVDFYDRLKTLTRGFGSMDYDFLEYRPDDLAKLDILVGGKPVDALAVIVHRSQAYRRGLACLRQMRKHIPRQMFEVALQAAVGSRIIARETIKAMRKNVTAKCYGGDVTRKRKLLERQKEGKRRMKRVGKVDIPQEAFLAVLSSGDPEG